MTKRDTIPAPHPDTPEWAMQFYDTLLKVYQEVVTRGRSESAVLVRLSNLETEQWRIEQRLRRLEGDPSPDEEDTHPGRQ